MHNHTHLTKKQTGATLVIGLILLLVMTLIGVTSMKSTALEEKMAGGLRNNVLADSGVESALREGESFLWNYFSSTNGAELVPDQSGTTGVYEWGSPAALIFRESSGWVDIGTEHAYDFTSSDGSRLAKNPRYIIEEMTGAGGGRGLAQFDEGGGSDDNPGVLRVFRVTARSVSGDGKMIAMAESVFTSRTK